MTERFFYRFASAAAQPTRMQQKEKYQHQRYARGNAGESARIAVPRLRMAVNNSLARLC
jgi:hypothetical protein